MPNTDIRMLLSPPKLVGPNSRTTFVMRQGCTFGFMRIFYFKVPNIRFANLIAQYKHLVPEIHRKPHIPNVRVPETSTAVLVKAVSIRLFTWRYLENTPFQVWDIS